MSRSRSNFNESLKTNVQTYNDYYSRLKLLALTIFQWKNLPVGMNEKYLENTLYEFGNAVFVKDKLLGFLSLKATEGRMNIYDEPITITAYGTGYNHQFNSTECTLILNNPLKFPTRISIELFAKRLANTERTIDTNINAQKTPVMILCDEDQRLTLENLYMAYDGNQPFIFGDKKLLSADMLKAIKTDAPFVADKLQNYKHQIWNEALTFLGINNANTDKKERLITDEVTANNELIELSFETMLATRQKACEDFNKLYGTNISVNIRENIQEHIVKLKNDERLIDIDNEKLIVDSKDDEVIEDV